MAVSLVIQNFETLSASGAYGGMRRLSPQTELMLISLYTYASLYRWSNENGQPLTPEQLDTIDNWTATAQDELMREVHGLKIGMIIPFVGVTIPDYALLCDGSTYDRADYPDLYDELASNYKISATQFVVPSMNNRHPRGTTATGEVGNQGGQDAFVLSPTNHAPHTHTVSGITAIPVQAGAGAIALSNIGSFPFPTEPQGNGTAKTHIPRYEKMRYIVIASE